MKNKTDKPSFNFLVTTLIDMDYYLFDDFDSALNKIRALSIEHEDGCAKIYEPRLNNKTREYFAQNTFTAIDGVVIYDKHGDSNMHLHFFVNAGKWLNPNVIGS